MYDYLFLDLDAPPGGRPYSSYVSQVRDRAQSIRDVGGEVLGLFTPQLGWRSGQAALLTSWAGSGGRDRAMDELSSLPGVRAARRDRLEATARPAAGDRPAAGGIYVHRWFVIAKSSLDEVVSLSTLAWRGFETQFDAQIFGLMKAAPTPEDDAAGQVRLLLMTRYADHGVWEASRDPSPETRDAFARRQTLTRSTWAASTLLMPI